MPDRTVETNALDYRQLFPWVRLFRAFRIAIDLRKMLLAALALLALAAGDRAFALLPFAPEAGPVRPWPWQDELQDGQRAAGVPLIGGLGDDPQVLAAELMIDPAGTLVQIATNWQVVLWPLWTLFEPALVLLRPDATWSDAAWGWTRLLWMLLVWGLFGGAITRMAAVQFARDEKVRLFSALKFSSSYFLSYLAAPLLPIIGLALLWALCLLVGLLGRIPEAGGIIAGVLWFIPLALAFLMTLLLLGIAAGWPLMYAAISTEASDGFDGFSRSYSYVYGRPWHLLWYAAVAMAYGALVIFFVGLVFSLIVSLAAWGMAAGMGAEQVAALHQASPPTAGTHLVGGWLAALGVLLAGFVYSYFWTAATIIYFLLRCSDDATAFDEVARPEDQEPDDLLPLVGVARSEHAPMERPVQPDGEPTPPGERTEAPIEE